MNIATASIYAKQGYKITRAAWALPPYLCDFEGGGVHFKDGLLMGGDTYFMLTADDLLADDWEVVK
jgi:hypothetical protein